MAEILKFRKLKPVKPENDTEKLKLILKRAVCSEKIPTDLKEKLGKLIRE